MKKNLLIARIAVAVIGILFGVILLVLGHILTPETVGSIIHWALVIYGVVIIIGNVPGLIAGIANIHRAAGVFDLITSLLGIGLGIALIFYQSTLLVALLAIYLIVFPAIRVLMATQKVKQLRRELLRMILGVVLLVFLPSLVGAAFTLVHLLLVVGGWIVIGLSVIFGTAEVIRIATAKEYKMPESGHIYVEFEETKDE